MTMNSTAAPTTRLSLFYGLYFALLGCIAPYWGLYLTELSFTPQEIGSLMALFGTVRILAPNLWAYWGRNISAPLRMVRVAGLLTLFCFGGIFLVDSFIGVACIMVLYGFFWAAMLPQYETITMQALGNKLDEYSRIRAWGSIGFIAAVMLLGRLFDDVTIKALPIFMLLLMAAIVLNSWLLKSATVRHKATLAAGNMLSFLRQRKLIAFILVTILLQIAHGPYYTFFSIFLEENGYSNSQIGLLWSIGVCAEVVLFWQFGRMMKLLTWQQWFLVSLALTGVRWCLVAWAVNNVWVLVAGQTLHAFSFAVMHAVSMRYIQMFFPASMQARGQALYSSVGFGLGGAIGAMLSGLLWQPLGGTGVFMLAALVASVALFIAWWGLRDSQHECNTR